MLADPGNGENARKGIGLGIIINILRNIRDLVFPVRCPVCDRPVYYFERKDGICSRCRNCLPIIKNNRCYKCGRALAGNEKELCRDCQIRKSTHLYARGLVLCSYNDVMRESIYRMKYQGRREYAEAYGKLLAKQFGPAMKRAGIEGIIPVPLHPKREYERGYNQAALLAETLGEETGIKVFEDYVMRIRHTPPMKSLSAGERQNNLKKAFKIGQNDVKLRVPIVIDDIYTTGSTIDAVAKVLIEAGVSRVYFITLAIGEDL